MLFDWQAEYGVGFPEMDGLHQGVFRTAADLHAAVVAGRPRADLVELLRRTVSAIQAHFDAEEALMQSSRYPETTKHQAAHETLAGTLRMCEQAGNPSVEMLQSLRSLLVLHIEDEDRKLGQYLAARTA